MAKTSMQNFVEFGGTLVFIAAYLMTFYIASIASPSCEQKAISYAIILTGTAIGLIIGTFISPDDDAMSARFGAFAKSATAFLSGIVVSKIDAIVTMFFNPTIFFYPINLTRTFLFVSVLLGVIVMTFIARTYLWRNTGDKTVNSTIKLLQKRFPSAFPKKPHPKVPLKLDIDKDLLVHAKSLGITSNEIEAALNKWCKGKRYSSCMEKGVDRLDLDGNKAGTVSEESARAYKSC